MKRKLAGILLLAASAVPGFAQALPVPAAASQATGRVILFRFKWAGISTRAFDRAPVWVDGRKVGSLGPDENAVLDLPPGRHVFRGTEKRMDTAIDVEAGETYYLRGGYQQMRFRSHSILLRVDSATGEVEVQHTRRRDFERKQP